jgi:hypothetical protein
VKSRRQLEMEAPTMSATQRATMTARGPKCGAIMRRRRRCLRQHVTIGYVLDRNKMMISHIN